MLAVFNIKPMNDGKFVETLKKNYGDRVKEISTGLEIQVSVSDVVIKEFTRLGQTVNNNRTTVLTAIIYVFNKSFYGPFYYYSFEDKKFNNYSKLDKYLLVYTTGMTASDEKISRIKLSNNTTLFEELQSHISQVLVSNMGNKTVVAVCDINLGEKDVEVIEVEDIRCLVEYVAKMDVYTNAELERVMIGE